MNLKYPKRGLLILGIALLALVVGLETVEWILILRGQEVRWFSILSATIQLLIMAAALIYVVIFLWRER